MARKVSGGGNMSMSELLSALTQAQKERETAMTELKTISEGERRKAVTSEQKADKLQEELDHARRASQDLNLRCQELENTMKSERENNERNKRKEEELLTQKLEKWKGKMEDVNRHNQELEQSNSELSDQLTLTNNKLKKAYISEENLKDELCQLKDTLNSTKAQLEKASKNQEMADAELHMTKMQLLKENNINNRLIDELKRTRKEVDEHKEDNHKLKKSKDNYKNSISQQIKELSILLTENNKDHSVDDLREIRTGLSTILKENFILNSRISDVYKYMTKGDSEVVHASTQTNIGLNQMYSFENMDREVTNLVMCLREELVSNKSDIIELKQQNQQLKRLLMETAKEKQRLEVIDEEENRVEKLEDAVKSLKQMLKNSEKDESEREVFDIIDQLRKDVDYLKRNNIPAKHELNEIPQLGLSLRPTKLITTRK